MKYILMMNCPKTGYDTFGSWPKEDIQAHIAFMHNFNKKLQADGEFVLAEGLATPHEAKLVRAGKAGQPITDGAFAETKEYLAGFWIVDVVSTERAYALAAAASAAPGPGGAPLNMPIEVRQVMCGAPEEFV
ncbi:MAG: YciI family protein [Bryobacteraceae bacterium]|nr:YciI family protein [Bryobacteraceae bacterium]